MRAASDFTPSITSHLLLENEKSTVRQKIDQAKYLLWKAAMTQVVATNLTRLRKRPKYELGRFYASGLLEPGSISSG